MGGTLGKPQRVRRERAGVVNTVTRRVVVKAERDRQSKGRGGIVKEEKEGLGGGCERSVAEKDRIFLFSFLG